MWQGPSWPGGVEASWLGGGSWRQWEEGLAALGLGASGTRIRGERLQGKRRVALLGERRAALGLGLGRAAVATEAGGGGRKGWRHWESRSSVARSREEESGTVKFFAQKSRGLTGIERRRGKIGSQQICGL